MLIYISVIIHNHPFTDQLGIMEDATICNAGGFRDFRDIIWRRHYHIILQYVWVTHSRISAIQCYNFFKEEDIVQSLPGFKSFNIKKGTLFSTTSKAADRSKGTSNTGLPGSIDIILSFLPEPGLLQCFYYYYMQTIVIH